MWEGLGAGKGHKLTSGDWPPSPRCGGKKLRNARAPNGGGPSPARHASCCEKELLLCRCRPLQRRHANAVTAICSRSVLSGRGHTREGVHRGWVSPGARQPRRAASQAAAACVYWGACWLNTRAAQ